MKVSDSLYKKGLITNKNYQYAKSLTDNELEYLKGIVPKETLIKEICDCYKIQYIDLKNTITNPSCLTILHEHILKKYSILVFAHENNVIKIATSKPYDYTRDEDLSVVLSSNTINYYFAFQDEIDYKKEIMRRDKGVNTTITETNNSIQTKKEQPDHTTQYSTVNKVDTILKNALEKHASDIHIEPMKNYVRLRYRIDGDLYKQPDTIDNDDYPNISARLKVLADLDTAEKRKSQDGRRENYKYKDKMYDMRISTMSTVYGEKIVIRILENKSESTDFFNLGFLDSQISTIQNLIKKSNGIVLLAGETGSGKTTTLYTILNVLNSESINICTVEDPVESVIPGLSQVQVNELAGITFSSALKTFLRQDPNIIMVGEIRDIETAETAIKASNTGHFVLSTIHTNSATSTINRLIAMGIEPYKISENIKGIISQKLLKKVCPHCKKEHIITQEEIQFICSIEEKYQRKIWKPEYKTYEGSGCEYCRGGALGRTVVSEILEINDAINLLIKGNINNSEFRNNIVKNELNNFVPIEIIGLYKVISGEVSLKEVLKTFR